MTAAGVGDRPSTACRTADRQPPGSRVLDRSAAAAEHDLDVRVWRVAHLHDTFHLYVDREGCVRGDHEIRFLGVRVITLHDRMAPEASA